MDEKTVDPRPIILVEFDQKGLAKVTARPEDMAEKSARAVDRAMETIRGMAERVSTTFKTITEKPQAVEVAFGLKLDAEAGALIARTGVEASINVKITWKSS